MNDGLLYDYFNGTADDETVALIAQWLDSDPSHQQEFDAAHSLYNAMILQEAAYARNKENISGQHRHRKKRWSFINRCAVVILIIVASGYAGKSIGETMLTNSLSTEYLSVEVPAGQRMAMTLHDGTIVHLNGGSKLEYPQVFDRSRRFVKLSGEAFFNVNHESDRPFIVETFASRTEVLGTEFNIYADEAGNRLSVTLLNGKVKVSTLDHENYEQVVLNPNERAKYVDNHFVVSKVSAADVASWANGYINLAGTDFGELMHRFENTFGVNIVIDREKDIELGYISGKIRESEGIDFALHLLQQASDFSYEKDVATNTIYIR